MGRELLRDRRANSRWAGRLDRERWERSSDEWRETVLKRGHAYEAERQATTVEKATARGRRWTLEEDALLLGSDAPPTNVLAEELGRTLYAIRARYQKLKGRRV
jgi:hypothetical protein